MLLSKKKYRLVSKVIDTWEQEGIVSAEDSKRLRDSLQISKFDWKRLAQYSFWIAGISLAVAVFTLIFDDALMALIRQILRMPDIAKSILFGLISAAFYSWGFKRKVAKPTKVFSNEFLLFIGAIISGASIVFFGKAIDTGSGHYSILLLIASIVYMAVGGFFPSVPMWVLGLIALECWFGTETGYVSGGGAYFLGMNYPLRFVLFGALMIAASFLMVRSRFRRLAKATYIMGLLTLFIALWIMSIFGNYGDMEAWYDASKAELLMWSLAFAAVAIGAIIRGMKKDDGIARGFGITFLFINLYTKYFEYFWKVSHKAIFFAVLAASFWVMGKYAEKVFNGLRERVLRAQGEE